MHRHGQGVAENTTKMLELFTRAADLNNSAALNGLGVYWLTVGKDVVKAKAYLQQAQDRGSGDGAFNLGALHAHMYNAVDIILRRFAPAHFHPRRCLVPSVICNALTSALRAVL